MPYASKAQQRAMHAKASRGEIPESVVREFDAATDFSKLPERKRKKKEREKKACDEAFAKGAELARSRLGF